MTDKTTRVEWIDFAKGLAMILVVLGHAIVYGSDLFIFIFTFHMPFFFVMSGFLLNLDKWSGEENYKKFSGKLISRLLVPYYLANFLWYPIYFVASYKLKYLNYLWGWANEDPLKSFLAIFVGNNAPSGLILGQLWFLPALFCAEIIFVKLYNHFGKIGIKIFVLAVIICSFVGLEVANFLVLPMGLDIALVSQIFLLAGVVIRKYNILERLNFKFCGLLILIFALAIRFNDLVNMTFRVYGNGLLFFAGGLAGTLLLMKISALISDGKIFSLISYCGRQSMIILIFHPIIIEITYCILVRNNLATPRELFTESPIILGVTILGVLIPLCVAKLFGKTPAFKYFGA